MKRLVLETTAPFQGLPELVAYDEGLFANEGLIIDWAGRDQGGKIDRGSGDGRDHLAHRSAIWRQRCRPFEMRTQGRALVHDRLPRVLLERCK